MDKGSEQDQKEKKVYEKPEIIHELELETKAGSFRFPGGILPPGLGLPPKE